MHDMEFVYKDINPENVLIFEDEILGPHANLVDFGFTNGEPLTIRRGTCTSPLSVRTVSSCLSVPHRRHLVLYRSWGAPSPLACMRSSIALARITLSCGWRANLPW